MASIFLTLVSVNWCASVSPCSPSYLRLFLFLSSFLFFFLSFFLSLSIYLSFPTQQRHALVRSSCYTRPVPPIKTLSIYRDMMCAFTTLIKVCVFMCVGVCVCVRACACVCACVRERVCVCRCWGDIQSLTFFHTLSFIGRPAPPHTHTRL
jgi:hypothetical protein